MRSFMAALLPLLAAARLVAGYDPLQVNDVRPQQQELTVKDEKRSRDIPIRVNLPEQKAPAAVVLFSHGLGGTRAGSAFLGEHWARRGYVAVFVQHPGSDDSIWRDVGLGQRMAAMRKAAGPENFLLRVRDIPAVLDQLGRWNETEGHPLAGRLDMNHIGMSGHSFGAVTTQAVSGQTFPIGPSPSDPRIKAAVIMSPSGPRAGADPSRSFGDVKTPWMLLTGTKDDSPIGESAPEDRLVVFPALPPGGKYELVLGGARHSVFTDRILPGDVGPRNPKHHPAILAVTTAFWDAYLREDAEAKAWLDGDAVRSVLEKADRWQRK